MDRNVAKEKIEKLLRLANNSGATKAEADNALEMAKKLAEKYGFKIAKNDSTHTSNASKEFHRYSFTMKSMDKKLVFILLRCLGVTNIYFAPNGVIIDCNNAFDAEKFCIYYEYFYKNYKKLRKVYSEVSYKLFFSMFELYFKAGYQNKKLSTSELGYQFMEMGRYFNSISSYIIK